MKKALFVIVSLGVGLLLILFISRSLFSTVISDIISKVNETKEYSTVERMYCYYTPLEDDVLYREDIESVHAEVFTTVRLAPICEYDAAQGQIVQKTTVFKECLEVVLFNVTSNTGFAFEDETDADGNIVKRGYVLYTFDNGESYKVYLNNYSEASKDSPYYGLNYYAYASYYKFLSVSLFYDEAPEGVTSVTNIDVYDGKEVKQYSFTFSTPLLLANNFDKKLESIKAKDDLSIKEVIAKFNEERIKGTADSDNPYLSAITGLETEELYLQVTSKIVTKKPKFIIWCVVLVVLYLGIDGFVGYMIFRKKPQRVVPRNANIPPRDHMRQKADVIDAKESSNE